MRTISKNTKRANDLMISGHNATAHVLSNGFIAEPVEMQTVSSVLHQFSFAKLQDKGDGQYTVKVHSNEWYTFKA